MSSEQASNQRVAASPSAHIINLGDLDGGSAHRAAPAAPIVDNANPLHAIRARLRVCVGEAELTVGELLSAKEHQVLVLDRAVDQPVDLILEGSVVARGQLVALDGYFALRITEVPVPLKT